MGLISFHGKLRRLLYLHVTVHHNKFLYNKTK